MTEENKRTVREMYKVRKSRKMSEERKTEEFQFKEEKEGLEQLRQMLM